MASSICWTTPLLAAAGEARRDDEEPMPTGHFARPTRCSASSCGMARSGSDGDAPPRRWRGPTIWSEYAAGIRKKMTPVRSARPGPNKEGLGSVFRKAHPRRSIRLWVCLPEKRPNRECSKIEALEPDLPRSSYLRRPSSRYVEWNI